MTTFKTCRHLHQEQRRTKPRLRDIGIQDAASVGCSSIAKRIKSSEEDKEQRPGWHWMECARECMSHVDPLGSLTSCCQLVAPHISILYAMIELGCTLQDGDWILFIQCYLYKITISNVKIKENKAAIELITRLDFCL